MITGIGFISKEEEETLSKELIIELKELFPEIFETMYDTFFLAGFKEVKNYVTDGWDTDSDESDVAQIARKHHENIHFSAGIRFCYK